MAQRLGTTALNFRVFCELDMAEYPCGYPLSTLPLVRQFQSQMRC